MPKVECILRTRQLAEELAAALRARGWSMRHLAREAGVSYPLVFSMFHPEHTSNVSKTRGATVIGALVPKPIERIPVLKSAGFDIRVIGSSDGLPDQVQLL